MDVFFVISGFLITSQLVRELRQTGRISFRGFYARRARRILPAATLTTVVTVVFAGLLLPPLAATRVFGDARAAAMFGANIHFAARDANYFSADLPPSPLQHYWSLSVEEQFYFLWPLLLVLSSLVWLGIRHRSKRAARADGGPTAPTSTKPRFRVVIVILAAIAALSFAGSILETSSSATLAYYSLGTRAWELAAGALVALSLPFAARLDQRLAGVITWTGVACIAAAALDFNNSTPYPGDAALLPVAGAAAIIFAGSAARKRWGAEALLGTAPFQRVGAWSYSWYLWHWPVLIMAPALLGHSLSKMEALTVALIALVIAVLSFVLVERPVRRMQLFVRRPSLGLTGGAALVATSLGAVALAGPVFASLHAGGPPVAAPVLVSQGTTSVTAQLAADLRAGVQTRRVPSNLNPSITAAPEDDPVIAKNGCLLVDTATQSRGCVYGDKASHTTVVLFGDSHGSVWFPAVDRLSTEHGWRLVVIAKSGCPGAAVDVVRFGRWFTACRLWRQDAERQIAALHPALVIAAYSQYTQIRPLAGVRTGYGSTWLNGTEATFRFLHRAASHVVYITDVPMLTQFAPDCVSGHMSDVRPCTVSRAIGIRYPGVTHQELKLAARNHISAIDSTPWFCTPVRCPVIVDNILVYRDKQHMTPQWSRFLIPVLAQAMSPVIDALGARHDASGGRQ